MTGFASLPVLRRTLLLIGILVLFCVRSGAWATGQPETDCSEPSDHDDGDDECDVDGDENHEDGGDDADRTAEQRNVVHEDRRSCDDHDACTADACSEGRCAHDPIPGCTSCSDASQCDDGNGCTVDACSEGGVCGHQWIDGCQRCESDLDCNDANPCTSEVCTAGACKRFAIADCKPCEAASDCDDGQACTADVCSEGSCSHIQMDGCQPCESNADCDDHNPCTGEACTAGACKRFAIADCKPCEGASDCNDGSACTDDTCSDGVCQHARVEHCTPCGSDADCNDGDACTIDRCDAGACVQEKAPKCSTPEICGDCIDNDGDGLVDYEDPDCCAQMHALTMQRMKVRRPGGKPHRKGLRLKAVYAESMPAGFDPKHQDTSIQLSDSRGQLFCKTIAASHWMKRRGGFKFWDMNSSFAGGLSDGRFMTRRNGRVLFRTQGKKVQLRSVDGGRLRVTVRVGGQCMQSSMALHERKNGLVFP